jgi:hypothetical protein
LLRRPRSTWTGGSVPPARRPRQRQLTCAELDARPGAARPLHGVTNGLSQTLFGATWPEIYGTAHLGAIRSTIMAVLVIASAIGPASAAA